MGLVQCHSGGQCESSRERLPGPVVHVLYVERQTDSKVTSFHSVDVECQVLLPPTESPGFSTDLVGQGSRTHSAGVTAGGGALSLRQGSSNDHVSY